MAATYPNRFYMHSAQTDRLHNGDPTASTLPTIWDRLAAGASRATTTPTCPFIALWGTKYLDITHPLPDFLADCASGDLPEVSFVDPRFVDEDLGTAGDDHPHSDIRVGQAFLNQVYEAITNSPAWKHTVFVINYDEWGGFFDHVPPPDGAATRTRSAGSAASECPASSSRRSHAGTTLRTASTTTRRSSR